MIDFYKNPSFIGLDLETSRLRDCPTVYALQPWRFFENTATITSLSVVDLSGNHDMVTSEYSDQVEVVLDKHSTNLDSPVFATYNGVFDIAWMLAAGVRVHRFKFVDVMILWKFHSNSQRNEFKPHWSLADAVKRWLPDDAFARDFLSFKAREVVAGENDLYWKERGKLDSYITAKIAAIIWPLLTQAQQRLAIISSTCLIPVAQSWLDGIFLDLDKAVPKMPVITDEMKAIEVKLGLCTPIEFTKTGLVKKADRDKLAAHGTSRLDIPYNADLLGPENEEIWKQWLTYWNHSGWVPSKILSSPNKLRELLYETWNLPCTRHTAPSIKFPKGQKASDKTALTYLTDSDPRLLDILKWRQLNTQLTKFILGLIKTCAYCQSKLCHPTPKLFSTYTGRMTYASKSGSRGDAAKAKIGIPLHQMPRDKQIRMLIPAFMKSVSLSKNTDNS